jgi:hypothetical protein
MTSPVDLVPIPERMRALKRDQRRGYPIPWGVYVDDAGKPHYTINIESRRRRMLRDGLCSICGQTLLRGRWFVGGPLSAFHDHGAYIDPPMHRECAHYALKVCPYLALPSYQGRVETRTLAPDDPTPILIDNTMIPERPAIFVCAMATGQKITENRAYVVPKRPFVTIEFWRDGAQISHDEGMAYAHHQLAKPLPDQLPNPRLMLRSKR